MANLGKAVKGKSRAKKKPKAEPKAKPKVAEGDYDKRMAAMLRKMLREKLAREKAMTRVNKMKVQNAWLKIMRLAKVDELRKEAEIIAQTHERDVDRRDAILQMLDRDLDEAEDQYQLALRQHLRNIDRLIELQDERLQSLEKEFEADLDALDKEFAAERASIVAKQSSDRLELETLIKIVAEEEREKMQEVKHDYDTHKEELRNKNVGRVTLLSAALDQQIEDLQREFEAAHLNYLHQTDTNTEEFKNLTRLDRAATKSIETKLRLIAKAQRAVEEWKAKIASNERDYKEKNGALMEEKQAMLSHSKTLKARMAASRKAAERRLVSLSKAAAETVSTLKEHMALGERVLTLAERSRALMTEEEKVVPSLEDPVEGAEGGEEKPSDLVPVGTSRDPLRALGATTGSVKAEAGRGEVPLDKTSAEALEIIRSTTESGEIEALRLFHRRYNKTLLDKLALEREQERLQKENEDLKSVMKQYLEGVSVPAGMVDGPNPLLVVNGRHGLNPGAMPVRAAGAPTVVEANHMVETGRVAMGPRR